MTLDDIRKLIEAATPGPWVEDGESESWTEDQGYASSWVETPKGDWRQFGGPETSSDMVQQRDDARFIAAARTLLPALLDVVAAAKDLHLHARECVGEAEQFYNAEVEFQVSLAALEAIKLP